MAGRRNRRAWLREASLEGMGPAVWRSEKGSCGRVRGQERKAFDHSGFKANITKDPRSFLETGLKKLRRGIRR